MIIGSSKHARRLHWKSFSLGTGFVITILYKAHQAISIVYSTSGKYTISHMTSQKSNFNQPPLTKVNNLSYMIDVLEVFHLVTDSVLLSYRLHEKERILIIHSCTIETVIIYRYIV